MTTLTKETIRRILGADDDALAATIQKLDATEPELIEARGWLGADEALHEELLRRFPSGRVAALVDLIREHEAMQEEMD
ncbi:hypothetical protein [Oceaniradius stylonematis]|uniref:hypothetical protein n=1 Tax=Oceaniradius stylonematis TaxID=2184161 RepID=UPI0035CFAFB9